MMGRWYQRLLPYGVAITTTALALSLSLALEVVISRTIGAFFYIAIAITAWYGGLGPAIVAIALSLLALNYYFIPPIGKIHIATFEDVLRLCIFVTVSLIITLLSTNLRDSRRKIEHLNRQLVIESADRLRIALNAAQMGMWVWNIVTGEITWSPEHEQLFGLSPGTFDGRYETFNERLHPDDRDGLNQAIAHALNTHTPYQHEYRIIWADGSLHWIEGRGQAFYDAAGNPVRMTGTVMAIDERKQTQFLLQQRLEHQRLIIEITQRIRQSLDLQTILQTTVDEVRRFLQVERVIIFQFTPAWSGRVTVESVVDRAFAIYPLDIHDPCMGEHYIEPFQHGLVTAKADIYAAAIDPCHVAFLEQFQVRANLVVPILRNHELWGLLAAHHCTAPRQWQDTEIELLQQIAAQVSIALQQADLFQQVQIELAERKQAEVALQERESLLRLFAQYAPAGIAMLDRDMRYVMASQRWVDEYNLHSIESLIHQSHYDIFPEVPERWRQVHQRCLAGTIEQCEDDLFVRADGTPQWISWEVRPWYTATHDIGGIIIFSVNVTQRKQAEIALRQSEERWQLAIAGSNDGIWDHDLITNRHFLSPRCLDMIGYTAAEVATFDQWLALVHPEDVLPLQAAFQRHVRGMIPQYTFEYRIRAKDGEYRWLLARGQAHWDEIGRPIRAVGSITDITERKQAEVALRNSAEQYRLLFARNPTPMWVYNPKTQKFLAVNDAAIATYGYSQAEFLDMAIADLHPPEDVENLYQTITHFTPQEFANAGEWQHRKRDGTLIQVEMYCSTITWLGNPARFILAQDTTRRKQAEAALRQLNQELEARVVERTAELERSNVLLRSFFDAATSAAIGLCIHDRDLRFVQINEALAAINGHSVEAHLGTTVTALMPEFAPTICPLLQQVLTTGQPIPNLEIAAAAPSQPDVIRYWLTSFFPIMDSIDHAHVVGVGVIVTEISDRKRIEAQRDQAELALRESEERRRLALDLTHIAFWDLHLPTGKIVWNDNHFTLLGREPFSTEPSYELWRSHVYPDDLPTIDQQFNDSLTHHTDYAAEYRVVHPDHSVHWLMARAKAIYDTDGKPLRSLGVLLDISDRKQIELVLQQQTTQSQLLWNIAQAIRQSLDLDVILNAAVTEVRQRLAIDRAAVYRFNDNWSGDFIAEAVMADWIKLVEPDVCKVWEDTYLQETQGGRFQNHETLIVNDIYTADLQPCHIELLEQFQARAYAIAPIIVGELLWGLFAIYQNDAPHQWSTWEVELLQQTASQLAIAIQQSSLYSQLQAELQERQQAAAILREAERRWRSLLDNVQLIVVGLDQTGAINYVNPFLLTLTGYTDTEIIGKNWFETFILPAQKPTIQTVFAAILDHNAHPYYQEFILTKSGEARFIAWNNTRLQDSNGNPIGTISIGEDITEQQKVEKLKNEFISIVSHELRTPLTSIRGSLGLLATGVMDDEPAEMKRMIDIAATDTERLVRLVNDVLDLEKLESGKVSLVREWCSAADLMQTAIAVMQSSAQTANVHLKVHPQSVQIWVAPDRIIQTFTNLLSNAIKFSAPGGTVTLAATVESGEWGMATGKTGVRNHTSQLLPCPPTYPSSYILFSVQDHGRGIPTDKLESVFGRFQQVDASDSRDRGGTGLGLAICKSIVQQHEGHIWVESIWGQGSTFFFALPLPLK